MRRPRDKGRPKGRLLRRIGANGAALAVIGALSWGAVNTPVFHARELHVSGAERLTAAQVLELAGVGPSTNVVRLSASGTERVLESSPWIADAAVTKELPGTVRIQVRERRPVAILRLAGRWATLAGDGTVLSLGTTRPRLPVIEGIARPGRPGPGDVIEPARTALAVAQRLAHRWRVAELDAGRDVTVGLASGVRVRYGDATHWREKNAALRALLGWAAEQGSEALMIDVRVPKAPTLRLAGGVPPPA